MIREWLRLQSHPRFRAIDDNKKDLTLAEEKAQEAYDREMERWNF